MLYLALLTTASAFRTTTASLEDDVPELDSRAIESHDDRTQLDWDGHFVTPDCVADQGTLETALLNLIQAVEDSAVDAIPLGNEAQHHGAAVAWSAADVAESCDELSLDAACQLISEAEEALQLLVMAEQEMIMQCIVFDPTASWCVQVVLPAYKSVDPYLQIAKDVMVCSPD